MNAPQVPVAQLYIFFGKKIKQNKLFSSFAHFLIRFFFFFAVVIVIAAVVLIWLPYTVWILTLYKKYDLQIFSPIQAVVFHFVDHLFCCEESDVVPVVYSCFCCLCIWCHIPPKSLPRPMSRSFVYVFLQKFYGFRSFKYFLASFMMIIPFLKYLQLPKRRMKFKAHF